MPEQVVRTRNVVAFGGKALKGLATAVIGGSIVLGGYLYTDRSQNTRVEQNFGTGAYMFYDDAVFSRSGSTNYRTAAIVNPYTVPLSVDKVTVECDDAGVNKQIPMDVGIRTSAQLYSSGSDVMNSRLAFTGATLKHSTGSFTIAVGGSIRATTASGSYPGAQNCQLRTWGHERYDK